MWNLQINHYSSLKCLLNDMLPGFVHYFIFRGQDGGKLNTARWM